LLANQEQLYSNESKLRWWKLWLRARQQALFELICETFKSEEKIQLLHKQPSEVDALLKVGAEKRIGCSKRRSSYEIN
jgi:tryptophanyl-tRNA synthetase